MTLVLFMLTMDKVDDIAMLKLLEGKQRSHGRDVFLTQALLIGCRLPMMLDNVCGGKTRKRAMELLEQFGMVGRQGFKPSELSCGQQQRVAIARALSYRPILLFAYEPTALDSMMGHKVMV